MLTLVLALALYISNLRSLTLAKLKSHASLPLRYSNTFLYNACYQPTFATNNKLTITPILSRLIDLLLSNKTLDLLPTGLAYLMGELNNFLS